MLRKKLEEAIKKFLDEKTAAKKRGIELPDLAEKLKQYVRPDGQAEYFIHFGSVKKLGINPKSKYKDTPTGIYAYQLTENIFKNLINATLPFAQREPYLVLFKPKNDKSILNFFESDIPPQQFLELIEKVSNFAKNSGISSNKIREVYENAEEEDTNNKIFWNFTRNISPSPFLWSSMFRKIGINGIIDHGTSTIHGNEPEQAVFFGRDLLDVIDIFDNKLTPEKITNKKNRELIKKGYFIKGDLIKSKLTNEEFWVMAVKEDFFTIVNKDYKMENIKQKDKDNFELIKREKETK